jgi:negative regulator of replication initiation
MDSEESGMTFIDAEFDTSSTEKIKYAEILMNQINYVRYLGSQDMGHFILFDLNAYASDIKQEQLWFSNISKFMNSVESMHTLLRPYHDEKYLNKIKGLKDKHKELQDLHSKKSKNNKEIVVKTMIFNLKTKYKLYSLMFEEALALATREKFIGGDKEMYEVIGGKK